MLPSARNSQTLAILQRMRQQGAPPSSGAQGLMGDEEPDEEGGGQGEEEDTAKDPDQSGTVTAGTGTSLNLAKKQLKRRS